ncbi:MULTISPECIES: DNA gyrase subunit A [Massilia]|uniref:DNA gyrase subunit A n=2 Tax=Massilia TaxID=149698 RepID=A0A7X3FY12_9BURK|nr:MULTISPECIES: DNA gyrase subunit A [Telluria group]KQY08461.1 DNA gyrase subunit A [Massilia sp. Root133]KQZ42317.1 DNA gyrase subunit A [Massilia sp. Root1485]MDN4045549.1 DNA gyrase subunit A [Massilia sp. YIM B02787]MVW60071.1 DNA gyrase subunit A [Telluria cellulosilytica]
MDQFAKETVPISLEEEMRKSYLDYAMSVIVGRALPDVRDGLKPVHRRVLYAMHEMNNVWNRPYLKCARVVGDTMGKYHPHGDASIYDTLVRMAQDFSLRYTLVDGQGNFGSIDGDSAAAMRYTECRLDKISNELLADIDKDTVDFQPNYDGKEKEPTVLPTKIPNLLINGSSGIAVGMATNIPPHNLSEVISGAMHVLRNPDCTIDELIELIPAPDFPTAGIIYGVSGVRDGYRTGRGRVVMRAKTHFEEYGKDGGRIAIIVDELPYQVNKKSLLERIAENVRDKKLEGISDIRDESDKSGMRVVIELKRGEVPEVVLNNLYKQTQLQDTFGMNMVALVNGQPKLLNLKQMLECFLSHRREVVTRRTVFELRKARERGHMLEGLAVALANIDDFIAIIKAAPTPPVAKTELMSRAWDSSLVREMLSRTELGASGGIEAFRPEHLPKHYGMQQDGLYKLSDEQAQEILQMRLQRLTGLEQDKIVNEYKEVMLHIADLLDILARPERVTSIIVDEMAQIKSDYADNGKDTRRSAIEHNASDLETEDLITPQDMVVTLSHTGYMKSQPISEYRAQKRGGRGKQAMATKDEDWIDQLFIANTHDYMLCFSNRGRMYWLKVWEVPQGSRNSRGKPIVNMFPLQDGEKITVILPLSGENSTFPEDHYVFMSTSLGTVKKTPLRDFSNPRKAGIIAVDLDDGDFLIGAALTDGKHDVMLFSDAGKAVRFDENDVRPMGRTARGVRGMNLEEGQNVIALLVAENEQQSVLTATENGFGKRTPITEYTRHGRGTKGMIAIQTSERNGKVVAATLVEETDEIMLITTGGVLIRTRVAEIREMGRATQGVTLIAVEDGTKLSGLQRVVETDLEETELEPAPE